MKQTIRYGPGKSLTVGQHNTRTFALYLLGIGYGKQEKLRISKPKQA